jgi:hypothetical protein
MMSDFVQDGGGGKGTRTVALPAGLHHGLLLQQGGPRGAGDRGSLPLALPSRRQGGSLPLQDGKLYCLSYRRGIIEITTRSGHHLIRTP